jgi:hypothetical protein
MAVDERSQAWSLFWMFRSSFSQFGNGISERVCFFLRFISLFVFTLHHFFCRLLFRQLVVEIYTQASSASRK